MASGLPDYCRGIDVAYQALSEMTVRPKYGGALLDSGSEEAWSDRTLPLDLISGKGMLYGGVVWLEYTSSQSNSIVWLQLDGVQINDLSFWRLQHYGINKPRSAVVTINKFDSTNYIYSVGFSYGLTFDSFLRLLYEEKHGTTPTIHWRLVYALL